MLICYIQYTAPIWTIQAGRFGIPDVIAKKYIHTHNTYKFAIKRSKISKISTGMYLNLRLGGSSTETTSSLAELSVLFWLAVTGIHLKSKRWETLLPLTPPLEVVLPWLFPELGGVPWIHFFFHLRTGPVNTVVGAYLADDRPSLAPTPSIYDGEPVLSRRLIVSSPISRLSFLIF